MNRFIGNDASIDSKITKAIEDTYHLTAMTARGYYGKGFLWEANFAGQGRAVNGPYEKNGTDGKRYMVCGSSRWGGSHLVR